MPAGDQWSNRVRFPDAKLHFLKCTLASGSDHESKNFVEADFYKFHTANLSEIKASLVSVARSLHLAIGRSDQQGTSSFTRLYALLLGAWAECRLQKLIYEPNSFSDVERATIRSADSQLDRWKLAIDLAFSRQYLDPQANFRPESLPFTARIRYMALSEMLLRDLKPLIELRNKLAHGQWVYPLTSDELGVASEQRAALQRENSLTLKLKNNLLSSLADVIHDLIVSKPTFERDFDDHFRIIESNRMSLERRKFGDYEGKMRDRFRNGTIRRARKFAPKQ